MIIELSQDQLVSAFEALVKGITNDGRALFDNESFEAFLDLGGQIVDTVEGAANIIKYAKMISSIPSKMFLVKVERYCRLCTEIPIEKRNKYIEKIGSKEFNKESVRILNIINHIDEMKKIDIIVKIYAARVNEEIDYPTFFRLLKIIDNVLYEDLIYMKENFDEKHTIRIINGFEEGLASAGLLISLGAVLNGPGYKYTISAKQIYNIVFCDPAIALN